jgi:hypothetical protein
MLQLIVGNRGIKFRENYVPIKKIPITDVRTIDRAKIGNELSSRDDDSMAGSGAQVGAGEGTAGNMG